MTGAVDRGGAPGRIRLRVRYPETDRMGIAYHAHYLVWFELGRTEWMRAAGCSYAELEESRQIFFPVIEVGARYHAPARYDEELDLATRLIEVRGVRVRFDYRLTRAAGNALLATGFTVHAAVGADGRVRRLPADLSRRLLAGRHGG